MVEVNPKLFVTCRLCLEVEGQYQIIPSVQEQIKYCFDINVEPFDRLPQLICRKCQNILTTYYGIKQNFLEKQKEFREKVHGNEKQISKIPSPQKSESESTTDVVNNKSSRKKKHKTKKGQKEKRSVFSSSDELDHDDLLIPLPQKTKSDSSTSEVSNQSSKKKKHETSKVKKVILRKLAMSSSSEESVSNENSRKKKHKTKRVKKVVLKKFTMSSSSEELDDSSTGATEVQQKNEHTIPWTANLCKYLVCRICSQKFQDKEGITNHIRVHSNLHVKYKNIFNISCLVVMEKIDDKPNVTNSNQAVVYSSDSYIQNEHNPYYYIMYHPKNNQLPANTSANHTSMNGNNDLTDHESIPRKRRRKLSRSSGETVVLNEHRNERRNDVTQVIDCIDIEDSSDASCESNDKSQTSSIDYKNEDSLDSKSIKNIIKMCYNRYSKKSDLSRKKIITNNTPTVSTLHHKVLSFGRKILNNRGINCTGLLRFLEYKDLKVAWKETSILNTSTDSKYVRIATRANGNDNSKINNEGWINIGEFRQETLDSNQVHILKKLKSLDIVKTMQKSRVTKLISSETPSIEQLPRITSVISHLDVEISKTVDPENNCQKLLNTSPVLHPKQLPKSKVSSTETASMNITRVFSGLSNTSAQIDKQVSKNDETNISSMPIIQSTESLAPLLENGVTLNSIPNENRVNPPSNSNPQVQYPRIKVKPVSELMPEKTTQYILAIHSGTNHTANQNILPCNDSSRNIDNGNNSYQMAYGPIPMSLAHAQGHNHSLMASKSAKVTDPSKEYIIMHTVEFPNEKTCSPFQYLKNLLLVHNITLLDTDSPLPPEASCLINLRYLYQQEKCDAIALTWSLFCSNSTFCIKVRDMQQRDIILGKLSPHWQWQFLKIYNNDVLNKILDAARKISNETYNHTKNFFTLLQSIQCRTI
ncbi:uncharacterized protein [Epargyreus clarus]|uniref:uncharacterized protein n=1 Tax=Epargyreus clarus TaxID=520877 RepID=UPI003C2C0166